MEKNIEVGSVEEFEKHKEDILKRLGDAISNGKPFFVIAEGDDDTMATAGGRFDDISRLLAISMAKAEPLKRIITLAMEALEFGERETESMTESTRRKADIDVAALAKGGAINIAESLDCKNCPVKDECKIFNLVTQDLDAEGVSKLLEELHKKHPEVIQQMGKGGDA